MDDQDKNQKKPEAKSGAPGVLYPLSSRLRPSYFDILPIDHRLSMRPASWITPSLVPPPGEPDDYFSLEKTSREHGPSQLPPLTPSLRKRKIDSISTSSPPSSPEASRAAPEQEFKRSTVPSWNDLGPCDDNKLYGDPFGLVPAPPPTPHIPTATLSRQELDAPPQEREENQSPTPLERIQAFEKAFEKQQREDLELASAKPSLSQDLEEKMLTSLSAYDLNIEKLRKDIDEHCDRIRERFDRLEKEKRDRRDNAIPGTYQEMAEMMFPGRSICELTVDERQMVRLERRRRLEKGHRERFGNSGNAITGPSHEHEKKASPGPSAHDLTFPEDEKATFEHIRHLVRRRRYERMHRERFGYSRNAIAGPSWEREQMVPPSPNFGEMIRQEDEKLRQLNRRVAAWRPSPDPRSKLPSLDHDDPVSQTPETSEQQSSKGIDAPVATASQKTEKKTPVFDDDLSEMIDQQRRFEERKKKRSPSSNPNDAVDMPEKEARKETDATIPEPSQEKETKTSPDNDTVMELEKDLREGQDSLTASPSSSQGQKRKRPSASDHEKSFFEHFEEMRKHVRESVEREKKRRKTNDLSFQECMNDLYPADPEIWKIDDEPLQVQSSKPVESRSDKDLGNGSLPMSDEYLSNEKEIRRLEESINDVSKGSAPFAGMAPLPTVLSPMPPFPLAPPMPKISNMPPWLAMDIAPPMLAMSNMPPITPIPPMPPLFAMDIFPNTPAMPYGSIAAHVQGSYLITLPPGPNPPIVYDLHAVNLGTSHGHTPWNPETETLEAVSDRPFYEWDDVKGVRNEMYGYLRRAGLSPVSIEACRVKGEQNVRLMVFVPMKDWPRSVSDPLMQESINALAKVLEDLGIIDVDVELWETDFELVVV